MGRAFRISRALIALSDSDPPDDGGQPGEANRRRPGNAEGNGGAIQIGRIRPLPQCREPPPTCGREANWAHGRWAFRDFPF